MSAWECWCGRPLSFALATLAIAMPIEVSAEPTEKPEVIEVSGKRSGYDLDGTSSATKTDTLLLDVPQSVSVITSQLIDDQSMRSMADVVRYVPGVQMAQGEGHRDAPVLRGNAIDRRLLRRWHPRRRAVLPRPVQLRTDRSPQRARTRWCSVAGAAAG